MTKECKHNYVQIARTIINLFGNRNLKQVNEKKKNKLDPTVTLRCKNCGDRIDRLMTIEEKKKYIKEDREEHRESMRLHKVWHKFQKEFFDNEKWEWKYTGYDLMQRVEAYAKRNRSIVITGCDDYAHAGAILVLVPHVNEKGHWGTSVLFINQSSNEQPAEFFLYPDHETALRKGLTEAKRKTWK